MFRADHSSRGSPRVGVTECDREASKGETKTPRPAKALQENKENKFPANQVYVQKRKIIRYLRHKHMVGEGGGAGVHIHLFLNLALAGGKCQS